MRLLLLLTFAFASASAAFGQLAVTLRSGDIFELGLRGVPVEFANEFTVIYTVGSDGTVNIPLVGDFKAEGLTTTQLQRAIEARMMSEKIFTKPTVIISVQNAQRAVFVGGNVRSPTRVQWSNDMTLISAINSAAGPTEFAGDKVRLVRGGRVEVFSRKKLRDPALDPKVLPGDQVDVL